MKLQDIGLDKEEFGKSKKIAEEILILLSQKDTTNLIGVLTALSLVAGGFIHKLPVEHHEEIIRLLQDLVKTSIKTYGHVDSTKKSPEVVH